MISPEYGQACAHITRVAVLGMICSPYKEDISWLLLPLWANLSFCLICTPDQHTRSGRESCCDMAVPFSYTFQQNPHMCCLWLGNATHLLSVSQPKGPRALCHQSHGQGGEWGPHSLVNQCRMGTSLAAAVFSYTISWHVNNTGISCGFILDLLQRRQSHRLFERRRKNTEPSF